LSDADPDAIHAGDQYAQKINNAVTGRPIIDRTTKFLPDVLDDIVRETGPGSGSRFGVKVHTEFGKRVRALDLPGIGQTGVEQTFKLNWSDFLYYGLAGSIRTDVVLRDPKRPDQLPIAVYDLKTGRAVLTPARVNEIREQIGLKDDDDVPFIMLHYVTGNATPVP
jgi:hypothetical protein